MPKPQNHPSHRPPHILVDNTWYFITAHIISKQNILRYPGHKEVWVKALRGFSASHNIKIIAWVVLDNHYHLLTQVADAKTLPGFVNQLHGSTSFQFNKIENRRGRKVWYSYWDSLIRGENDFWTKFNYIHYNPVKHRLAHRPEDWPYSSYKAYLEEKGMMWVNDCWESFPIVEYNFE
jgi:putative transposase